MVTKRISRRDHEKAFGGGVGKNFHSPKNSSWWPKEFLGETTRFLVVTKRISRRDHEEAFGRGVGKNFHSPKDSSWWPKESHGETARFLVVTKRISRRDHEEAFSVGAGKNFDSPKDFSWWPKESHGETARFLMVTKTSRWDNEEPLVVGSRSNWAFTKRKSLYLTVRISWSPRGIHGPHGHCMTFMQLFEKNISQPYLTHYLGLFYQYGTYYSPNSHKSLNYISAKISQQPSYFSYISPIFEPYLMKTNYQHCLNNFSPIYILSSLGGGDNYLKLKTIFGSPPY